MNSKTFNSTHARGGAGTMVVGLLILTGLLVLPVMALHRRGLAVPWGAAYGLVLSGITYWTYARDKRRAQEGEWRVSEARLHLLELLGGWPGAWLAQRRLRHKSAKGGYLLVFWLIVLGYQGAALDSFQDWRFSRAGLKWMEQTKENRGGMS